jgi:hypothetical protein
VRLWWCFLVLDTTIFLLADRDGYLKVINTLIGASWVMKWLDRQFLTFEPNYNDNFVMTLRNP